jgi:hypothetical protein
VNPLPPKAMITHWNQIKIKIRNIQEGDIIVAPANLMVVSRGLNAVFVSLIFGMPGTVVLCLAPKDQTISTIINYPPNRLMLTVEPLLTWSIL